MLWMVHLFMALVYEKNVFVSARCSCLNQKVDNGRGVLHAICSRRINWVMDRNTENYDLGTFWAEYYGKEDYQTTRAVGIVNGEVIIRRNGNDILERGSLVSSSSMYGNRMKRRIHVTFQEAIKREFFYFDTQIR